MRNEMRRANYFIQSTISEINDQVELIEAEKDLGKKPKYREISTKDKFYPYRMSVCFEYAARYPEGGINCKGCPVEKTIGACGVSIINLEPAVSGFKTWKHYCFSAKIFIRKLELVLEWLKKDNEDE